MPPKSGTPSIRETAFGCPHCGAYTSQTWHVLYAQTYSAQQTPSLVTEQFLEKIRAGDLSPENKEAALKRFGKALSGLVCLFAQPKDIYTAGRADNLHLSCCFNCGEFSVWVYDKLVFPESRHGPPPNPDMPANVRVDYEEASKILNLSPRGAAALLRLAIQKLCADLGETGENINDDIASLVKKGLPQRVQKALDSVRVIGNEAVHPGTIDLKDDTTTAAGLFRLVNIIVEQMISNQRHIDEFFEKLPEEKRKAIDKRDGKTRKPD